MAIVSTSPSLAPAPGRQRPTRILIIDDEANIRATLEICLEAAGHQVASAATAQEAIAQASRGAFDLIFLDVRLGVSNGLDLIPRLLSENPTAKVVVITAYASAETAMIAMDRGAADYLPKPFTPAQVQLVVRKMLDQRRLELKLGSLQAAGHSWLDEEPLTTSSEMRQALDLARRLASGDTTLLITGEPGTGKEHLARAIHGWSSRAAAACMTISCANASADALDGALFGRAPLLNGVGAEPGAASLCDGGTLILQEIAAAPLALQPKLARLMHDKEFERQEESLPRKSNVRVIATTTQNLELAVERRTLRVDLMMAVNIVQIELPPIRQRPQDIRLFCERFMLGASQRAVTNISPDAMDALVQYSWPGNLRELREVIERAALACRDGTIGLEHLPPRLLCREESADDMLSLDALQEKHIRRVLQNARSMEAAAAILGIDPTTLWRRRRQYGLE